jgi:hypothetical protein
VSTQFELNAYPLPLTLMLFTLCVLVSPPVRGISCQNIRRIAIMNALRHKRLYTAV